jgi:hypothetical protein
LLLLQDAVDDLIHVKMKVGHMSLGFVWIASEAKCSCGVRVQLDTFWVEMCTGFQSRFEMILKCL